MNGKELLEAMSFIDEELLVEAEAPVRKSGWTRWGALAACLCILLLGTFSFRKLFRAGPTEGIDDSAAPETAMAAGGRQDNSSITVEQAEEDPRAAGSSQLTDEAGADADASGSARVRIMELTENGFIALILTGDPELGGMTVTAVPEEGIDLSEVEEGKEYTVRFTASEEDGILRIFDIRPTEQED